MPDEGREIFRSRQSLFRPLVMGLLISVEQARPFSSQPRQDFPQFAFLRSVTHYKNMRLVDPFRSQQIVQIHASASFAISRIRSSPILDCRGNQYTLTPTFTAVNGAGAVVPST